MGTPPQPAGSLFVSVPGDNAAVISAVAAALSCGSALGALPSANDDWCILVVSVPSDSATNCLLQAHVASGNGSVLIAPACLASAGKAVPPLSVSAALAPAAPGALAAAVTYSSASTVYGATACISGGAFRVNAPGSCNAVRYDTGESGMAQDGAPPPPPPLPFDVGSEVDVVLSTGADGTVSVFESHGLGWCPSTEARNKQALPKLCDQRPANPPSGGKYLNWAFAGRLADFTGMLLAGVGSSPCSETVLHGCFGMGAFPAAALVPVPVAGSPPLLAVLHAGISGEDPDPDTAGAPLPYAGLLLDGWPLRLPPVP
jgi:hypothetical protein